MPKEYTDCVQRLMADGKTKAAAQKDCAIAFYKKHGISPKEAEKMSEDIKKFAELSHDEKRNKVMEALDSMSKGTTLREAMPQTYPWIKEMFDDKVVVDVGGDLFEYPYTIAADGVVTMGEPKQVQVVYEAMAELTDIEIFEAGTYKGKAYTDGDLDTILQNFKDYKDEIKPVAIIGHDEDQELLKKSGLPAAGWMESVRKAGSKLVASFKDVPQVIADLVNKKAYKRISSEIYNDYNGKGLALRRVAILGGDIPEVKTLGDIVALYADNPEGNTTWVGFNEKDPAPTTPAAATPAGTQKEVIVDMDIHELTEQVLGLNETVTKMKEDKAADVARIKELEEKEQATVTKLSEAEQQRKEQDIKRFCTDRFREGRISPALLRLGLGQFMVGLDDNKVERFGEGPKTYDLTPLGFMKNFILSIPKNAIVKLEELGAIGADPNANNTGKTASERLAEGTKELMEKDKTLKYGEAFDKVQQDNPDLAKEYAAEIQGQ